jgi:hypothetical protein
MGTYPKGFNGDDVKLLNKVYLTIGLGTTTYMADNLNQYKERTNDR